MLRIYCATGFKFMDNMIKLVETIRNESILISTKCQFCIPQLLTNTKHHSYVYSDIEGLRTSDVLLIHIPEPSVGACCELGFFKASKPHNPIIAYRCMDHPWIKHLSDFYVDDYNDVIDILETFLLSKTYS